MRIISWNVNGIRAAEKKGFSGWLCGCGADVVCLQETKARPDQLPPALLEPGDGGSGEELLFEAAFEKHPWRSFFFPAKKPGYSGTAIYTRIEPDETEPLGVEEFDCEGRVAIARFGKLAVISAYFPNSQGAGARLPYKLAFCGAILRKCDELVASGLDVVLCGDYNIAHKPIDLAHPKANEGNAGYLPEERAWMDTFTQSGYTDTFRLFCSEGGQYSWWSYRQHARENNVGWRIDYLCVNDALVPRVKESVILPDVYGSDHCPVALTLAD